MASHVIGPLLIAERPLTADEIDTLDGEPMWTDYLLAPTTGYVFADLLAAQPLTARLTASPVLTARLEATNGQ